MPSKTWTGFQQHAARRTHVGTGIAGALAQISRALGDSLRRARQRRDLAALSDHALRDIGLTRSDVAAEVGKPFWRA
jgi:uncharacterized protein YjiS (DUF1127 family)